MIPRAAGVYIIATNCTNQKSTKTSQAFVLQGIAPARRVVAKVIKMHSGWALDDLYPPIYAKRMPPIADPKIGVVRFKIMT